MSSRANGANGDVFQSVIGVEPFDLGLQLRFSSVCNVVSFHGVTGQTELTETQRSGKRSAVYPCAPLGPFSPPPIGGANDRSPEPWPEPITLSEPGDPEPPLGAVLTFGGFEIVSTAKGEALRCVRWLRDCRACGVEFSQTQAAREIGPTRIDVGRLFVRCPRCRAARRPGGVRHALGTLDARVLETLASGLPRTLQQITKAIGADKSNMHRTLGALVVTGRVRFDPATKTYSNPATEELRT